MKLPQGVRIALNFQLSMKEPKSIVRNQWYLGLLIYYFWKQEYGHTIIIEKRNADVLNGHGFPRSWYQNHPQVWLSTGTSLIQWPPTARAWPLRSMSPLNEHSLRSGGFWVRKKKYVQDEIKCLPFLKAKAFVNDSQAPICRTQEQSEGAATTQLWEH